MQRVPCPSLFTVRQRFPHAQPLDLPGVLEEQLGPLSGRLKPGATVGVAAGSRGISRIDEVERAVVDWLKAQGCSPFIFPAMGSHGGATAEGQARVLADYGITEASMGAPIRPSMDVARTGATADGMPVFCARVGLEADGIILVNRIKPHTDFRGDVGSGLMKMAIIGLGKRDGAAAFHRAAAKGRYAGMIEQGAAVNLQNAPILGGVALVENPRHQLMHVEWIDADRIPMREPEIFQMAAGNMARLPFEEVDLLVIDEIGKNISGTGMDTNVIGRGVHGYHSNLFNRDERQPFVKRILVRGLSGETHGNAIGIGIADFTLKRVVDETDWVSTYVNTLTSNTPQNAKVPIHFETDEEVMDVALRSLALDDGQIPRVVWIHNTLALETLRVSEPLVQELRDREDIEIVDKSGV